MTKQKLTIIILAAGKGKRMSSGVPKVLHTLAGIPLLEHVINTAKNLKPDHIYVVYGNGGQEVRERILGHDIEWIQQKEALGTGHAVMQVLPHLQAEQQVLILYGDVPLISATTLRALIKNKNPHGLGILVTEFDNPTGFGRIIRDESKNILSIVEEKDTTSDQKKIKEINTGIMFVSAQHLKKWLPKLSNHGNAQSEYYLTDVVAMAVGDGVSVHGSLADCPEEVRGVNNLVELAHLEHFYQRKKAHELLMQGIRIMDSDRFDLRGNLIAGQDTLIDINVVIEGNVTIGERCTIGPNVVLRNVTLGDDVTIEPNCVIEDAIIAKECTIGPFARIRPGTKLDEKVRVGNFVEVKNTQMGKHSKANHLSYLGDTQIGEDVNIGAGVITVNYDGANKHQTIIEDYAFIGCDSQLIAPVVIGKNATIGAGSTITQDAPKDELTIARSKQQTISGWQRPKKKTK